MPALSAHLLPVTVNREPLVDQERTPVGKILRYVHRDELERYRVNGPDWKYFNADLIGEVIERPLAIFQGLKRPGMSDGLCYVGRPDGRWLSETRFEPMPFDELFLVFTSGVMVFDWEFRLVEPREPDRPRNHADDFEELIWPTYLPQQWMTSNDI